MAMLRGELLEWVASLPDDARIGISDDFGTLEVVNDPGVWCEVGWIPEDPCECGRPRHACIAHEGGDQHGDA